MEAVLRVRVVTAAAEEIEAADLIQADSAAIRLRICKKDGFLRWFLHKYGTSLFSLIF